MAKFAAILLAAGKSSRFHGKEKKPYADLDGRAVWLRAFELFTIREDVAQILIVIDREDQELFERRYRANVAFVANAKIVHGGAERSDSVRNALSQLSNDIDYVAVHDTARACLTREMLDDVLMKAVETGAAILATKVTDTLKKVGAGNVIEATQPREALWAAQTPQVFRKKLLTDAHARWDRSKGAPTDDAMMVEALGEKVTVVECDWTNMKITTAADLRLAAAIIKSRPKPKDAAGFHPFGDEQMWS
jgi:2-C-methyl-D-erythritol 4-phosphate cytidylyltransferase